jgi:uncharacterized protein YprB with RNaseH-like and TPR domain
VETHRYPLASTRGESPLGTLLQHPTQPLARVYPDFRMEALSGYHAAAFLDTETTGLGTGAGVYAFMVGIGTFEALAEDEPAAGTGSRPAGPSHFVVRQIFMRNPAEELALISEVVSSLAPYQLLVTFNGRSFDVPLLRARLRYNRPYLPETLLNAPLLQEEAPHLDLLLPARRLWRRRLQSCRLAHLEEAVLSHERTESDVPGYLIPQLYADYVRSGESAEMERVFYHNREDIVSMVSLTSQLTIAFDQQRTPERRGALQGKDWLSLGIAYEHMEDLSQAEEAYVHSLESAESPADKAEGYSRLSKLQKRQGRWEEAAETWQLWLTSVPGVDPSPYVELAKYCEWQLQDFEQAEMWASWALHELRQVDSVFAWARTIDELEHRLQRIRRKRNQ